MAARKFLIPVDLSKNELQNAVMQNLGSAPGSPAEGQMYYDTTLHQFGVYQNGAWAYHADKTFLLARANHTGTQLASTISDFDAQVRTSRLDQMTAPTTDVSANSHKITNVTDPTSAQDAATKNYVDNAVAGLAWKDQIRVATTVSGTLGSAFANGQVVDGITLVTGDRILLKNQSTPAENGIYVVAVSGAPTRATDADTGAEMQAAAGWVSEGTTNGGTSWVCTTTGTITIGSTSLTFAQFGAGSTYTAGNGLQLGGSAFSVKLPGSSGLTADGTGTYIDKTIVMTRYAADIGDGSTTSIVVTHSLGTKDVQVQIYDKTTPFAQVECDVAHTSTSAITLVFAIAPTTNQYRVVVQG